MTRSSRSGCEFTAGFSIKCWVFSRWQRTESRSWLESTLVSVRREQNCCGIMCVCKFFLKVYSGNLGEGEKLSLFCLIPPDFWSDFSYSFAVFSSLSHSTCFSPLKYSSGVFPAWGYFSLLDWTIFWFLFKFKGNHQWDGSFETTWDRTDFKSFLISFFFFSFLKFNLILFYFSTLQYCIGFAKDTWTKDATLSTPSHLPGVISEVLCALLVSFLPWRGCWWSLGPFFVGAARFPSSNWERGT